MLGLLLIFLLSIFACAAAELSSLQLAMLEPVCLLWAVPHDEPCCARSCPPKLMFFFMLAADPELKGNMFSWQTAS